MSALLAELARTIPLACQTTRCDKDRCRVDLAGAPSPRVLVDMDGPELLNVGEGKRGDYVFFGYDGDSNWVAPIELKSGRFSVSHVLEQLQETAAVVAHWLPQGASFQFVPILAHGRTIGRPNRLALLAKPIQLRGQRRPIELIRCGGKLTDGLKAAIASAGSRKRRRRSRRRKSK